MNRLDSLRALLLAAAGGLGACGGGGSEESRAAPGAPEGGSISAGTAATAAVPADAPLVVVLGDSIAAGLHLEPAQAFPALLQRALAAEGHPFRLVNAGVSGDTSAGGLRRLDWLLAQRPDVLVLELGGNDGLRGQPVGEIEARLREILARVRRAGVRALLLGVRLPPSLGADYVREFEELYPRLAEELEVRYVPFFMRGAAGVPGMMLADGIHPNAAGHEQIAENLKADLVELLGE